jgi:hypothetical protein
VKCPCGFDTRLAPSSAAWHRAHKANHLEVYPRSTPETIANLSHLVEVHERREAVAEVVTS